MSARYVFGEIAGHPIGSTYVNRPAVAAAGVHQLQMQGIAGNRREGCVSIVLNGGYDTDEDHGETVIYTGSGGQDPKRRGAHIADQDWSASDNAALLRSQETGRPIRIVRGAKAKSRYSPDVGFRYDGLYRTVAHWERYPQDGFRRCMFHLIRLTGEEAATFTPTANLAANRLAPALVEPEPLLDEGAELAIGPPVEIDLPPGDEVPRRMARYVVRVVRDTAVAARVKRLYGQACQVCGDQLKTKNGPYVEGAHIRPLGKPHYGPDTMSNILCLCPNHHALFDKGGLYLDDDLRVFDADDSFVTDLRIHHKHDIDPDQVRYHRGHQGFLPVGDAR